MLLTAQRDRGIHTSLVAGLLIGAAAEARIRDQGIQEPACVRQGPLQDGLQMHRIAGLMTDTDRHDHQVIAIDGSLAAIALVPTVTAVEDVAVGIREVTLRLGAEVARRIGGEMAARHRLGIAFEGHSCKVATSQQAGSSRKKTRWFLGSQSTGKGAAATSIPDSRDGRVMLMPRCPSQIH